MNTFILAQVTKFEDLKELGDETAVKAKGKLLQKGKDYAVEDGDIIYFRVRYSFGVIGYSESHMLTLIEIFRLVLERTKQISDLFSVTFHVNALFKLSW